MKIDGNLLHAIRVGLQWPDRKERGASLAEFGALLGYRGDYNTRAVHAYQLEIGRATITPQVARLALMLELFGIPSELLELENGKEK